MEDFTIRYLHPAEPEGGEPVVAAVVATSRGEQPMTIRRDERGDEGRPWTVEFGDVADEGSYPLFSEALEAAHRRALGNAEELLRATQSGGY